MTQLALENEIGAVDESTEGEEDLRPRINAAISSTDWTVGTILDQIRKERIELSPRYQRREAWTDDRKSRFIESLFLGLPVPQLVLAERRERKGTFIVIDGKQRLITLRRFGAEPGDQVFPPLELRNLTVRPDLNGRTYDSLLRDATYEADVAFFENQSIRTVVIRNWPDEDFLYLLFLRLNTGSVPLSPQELRQALVPGPFVEFVDERASASEPMRRALRITQPDFRMRDVELLIRFCGLGLFLPSYSGNLKKFLDTVCEELNRTWSLREGDVRRLADECDRAIDTTFEIFGDDAFQRWTGTEYQGRFNRAVFDIMTYYFRHAPISQAARVRAMQTANAFKDLCTRDEPFREALTTTTKSVVAVSTRLALWGTALRQVLGVDISVPRLDNGHIHP